MGYVVMLSRLRWSRLLSLATTESYNCEDSCAPAISGSDK